MLLQLIFTVKVWLGRLLHHNKSLSFAQTPLCAKLAINYSSFDFGYKRKTTFKQKIDKVLER